MSSTSALLEKRSEADVFYGDGRNNSERLLVRDAVFASEDLTVQDMVSILISAPFEAARLDGDPVPVVWEEHLLMDERTPLVFVHCVGIRDDLAGHREVVLEAVDFESIDTLSACARAIRQRHSDSLRDVQESLVSIRKGVRSSGAPRRR